jgi:NADH-quinone oxidoreductase subunit M
VEAPTAGSVLLAGVLLKMGTYGLLRFMSDSFPTRRTATLPGSWLCADRHHLRRAGFAGAAEYEKADCLFFDQPPWVRCARNFQFHHAGLNGAVFVMLAHGVATGGLFMLCGILYERRHTYEISEFGGLATPMPKYATFFLVTVLASVGLPLLNGFIGEFLVLSGAFQARPIYGILAATGVIWSACYLLWMYQRVFFGKVTHDVNNTLPDLNLREKAALAPIAIAALVMGVAPLVWLSAIDPAVQRYTLAPFTQLASKVVGQ